MRFDRKLTHGKPEKKKKKKTEHHARLDGCFKWRYSPRKQQSIPIIIATRYVCHNL